MSQAIAVSPNPLIAQAIAAEGLTVAERLAIIDKINEIDLARQQAIAESEYSTAMSLAQSKMGQVIAKSKNSQTNSKYAKYDAVDKVIRPVYSAHGFALSFYQGEGAPADNIRLVCRVSHSGGHTERPYLDMPIDGKGAKGGDVMTKTHATGNGISYGKRYLAGMVFNLAITEEDNDGNKTQTAITRDQVAALKKIAAETKSDIKKFCAHFKVDALEKLPASEYENALKAFEKKRARITESQAADLQAIAEEVKADVPKFCEQFGVKALANLPASKYADALTALQSKRGA